MRQLKAAKETEKLFELLSIFGSKGIDSLEQFVAENPDVSREIGVSNDDLFGKLRLLLLSSIGTLRTELSFEEIISNLKISEDRLEETIIDAIGFGVLDARIDQINRSVVIMFASSFFLPFSSFLFSLSLTRDQSETKPREFPAEWWGMLQQRLGVWEEHISSVQQAVSSINSANPAPSRRF